MVRLTLYQEGREIRTDSVNLNNDGFRYLLQLWDRTPRLLKGTPTGSAYAFDMVVSDETFAPRPCNGDWVKIVTAPTTGPGKHYIGFQGYVTDVTVKGDQTFVCITTHDLPEPITVYACDVELVSPPHISGK